MQVYTKSWFYLLMEKKLYKPTLPYLKNELPPPVKSWNNFLITDVTSIPWDRGTRIAWDAKGKMPFFTLYCTCVSRQKGQNQPFYKTAQSHRVIDSHAAYSTASDAMLVPLSEIRAVSFERSLKLCETLSGTNPIGGAKSRYRISCFASPVSEH